MKNWQRTLLFSWIAQFFSIMGFSFAIPFAPFYLQELGVTGDIAIRYWAGAFASAAGLSMAFVTPFWGYLADRMGKKLMTLRASLAGTVLLFGMGMVQTPQMLLLLRFIQGIFTGTVTAYLTLVVSKTPKERMGLAIGLMNSAVFLGNSISPLIGGVFADQFGYRASFFISSGLLFASFLMSLLCVREDFTPDPNASFSFFSDIRGLLLSSGVLPIIGMIYLYGISRTLQRPVIPLLVQDVVANQSTLATQAGLVSSAAGLAAVLAGILMGTLADRGSSNKLGILCALMGGGIMLFMTIATAVWQLALINFLAAIFIGGIDPILKVILTRVVPIEKRGSAFGLIGSARAFGWFSGSFSGGVLAAILGLRPLFGIITGLFVLMAGTFVWLGKKSA